MTEAETQLEGCLATEAVLITVDVMELIVQVGNIFSNGRINDYR